MRTPSKLLLTAVAATGLTVAGVAAVLPAAADEDGRDEYGERYERERAPKVNDPLVKKECGACHMAYPRAFLPASSWAQIMDNLGDHFGENAFLSEKKRKAIRAYYTGKEKGGRVSAYGQVQAPLRITETRWWQSAHRGEVRPGAFKSKEVGSPANCAACHNKAKRGIYED